jgi:hypothetical protein
MGLRVGVLASLAVLTAGACGGPGSPSSTGPDDRLADFTPVDASIAATSDLAVPGRCLGGERLADEPAELSSAMARFGAGAYQVLADDPVWTDVVSCTDAHSIEIYAAVRLPVEIQEQVTSYADLLSQSSAVALSVDAAIDHECSLAIGPSARVMNRAPIELDVAPAVSETVGHLTWAPVPASAWDDGDHAFGCLFEQPEPTTSTAADLTSGTLPDDQRLCLSMTDFVSCAQPHDSERIAVLTVDQAVAQHQLAGAQAVNAAGQVDLGVAQWAILDHVCERYLMVVSGQPVDGIRGVANSYPDFYPGSDGHYTVVCSAQSPFGTPVRDRRVTTRSVYDAP